ncbi:DUF6113 family protein [Streptomyces bacillaris]|uniref:DUF6113 family protein n=1 Tax=Streptomyces cavourensis TaxID=67258 RepID=A0ABY5F354_9ACTN|nr:DUF6113 family protein [Streptomyces cavourensis]UTR78105.1 DUF6113 family protein [Streptomyces cavourensis]
MSGQNGRAGQSDKSRDRDRDRARTAGGGAPGSGAARSKAARSGAPSSRNAPRSGASGSSKAAPRTGTPRTGTPPRAPEGVGFTGFTGRPNPARIAAYFGLAVLGALVALAGTLVQAAWFPGGLIIALAGSAGLFYGGRILTGTQIGALAPAVGWFITVFLLLSGRPEGDYVFGDELGLALFMLGGTAVAVMCATTSKVPQSATRRGRSGI